MVKFLNTTPLPLRIWGSLKYFRPSCLKLKIINHKVFKHYSITFNNIGGGLKTETGNIFGGSKN